MFKPSFSSSSTNPGPRETGAGVKYKGVRLRKWGKYVSEIRLPNSRERIWLGSYDSAEKAARAFDAAQFCLRGRNANFNFPDSSSRIEFVEYSRPLTPSEIQEFASRYANGEQQEPQPTMELPADYPALPASETLDYWPSSYYDDMVVAPAEGTTSGSINNVVPDYDLMMSSLDHMHEDMYMTPHLGTRFHDDDSNGGQDEEQNVVDEQYYSQQSFLWNF